MRRFLLAIGIALCTARAAASGEISGSVLNGSKGNVPVPGTDVVLAARGTDGSLDRRSAVTDQAGRYRFDGLAEDTTVVYVVNARFAGADHPSPFLKLNPGHPSVAYDAVVFEFSPQTAPVHIEAAHWIVAAGDGFLEVTEVYQLVRQGHSDAAMSGGLRFALPAGYENLVPREGMDQKDVRLQDGGFVLDAPIEPGTHQFVFTYDVPADRFPVRIEHELPYPADAVNVLVSPETAEVGSETLAMHGVESIGDRQFLYLSEEQVPAGHPVSLVVTSLEGGGVRASGPGLLAPLAAALLVTGVFAVPVSRVLARRRPRAPDRAAARRRLVEEIAVLDLRHEAGAVEDADYRAARTALMNRLHILARKMEEA